MSPRLNFCPTAPEPARHLAYAAPQSFGAVAPAIQGWLDLRASFRRRSGRRHRKLRRTRPRNVARLQLSFNIFGQQRRFGVLQLEILQNIAGLVDAGAILKDQNGKLLQRIVFWGRRRAVPRHFGNQFKRQSFLLQSYAHLPRAGTRRRAYELEHETSIDRRRCGAAD